MAKRRSYASVVSYITPPFDESRTRHIFTELQQAIEKYYELKEPAAKEQQSLVVKRLAVGLGVHRDRVCPYEALRVQGYRAHR